MLDYMNPKSILKEIGVTAEECNNLNDNEAIEYLIFHQKKNWGKLGVIFLGFHEEELILLHEIALINKLTICKNFNPNVKIICIGKYLDPKKVEKAKNNCPVLFSSDEFLRFLENHEYSLTSAKIIFDTTIPKPFRLAKPLSNFDFNEIVYSLAQSENFYVTNLHKMNCTCAEFTTSKKSTYMIGDLRRLCKHQVQLYRESFGVYNLSLFANCVLEEGYGVKNRFNVIKVDGVSDAVVINFDQIDQWWDVYIIYKTDGYKKYGYHPKSRRFSYNDKPIGILPKLREKLMLLENSLLS